MKKKIRILDCTLRDGGYYNNWFFKSDLVKRYLNDIKNSSIDAIELGFRFPDKKLSLGPHAYTLDSYLNEFEIPKKVLICVMINAKNFFKDNDFKKGLDSVLLNKVFKKKNNSCLNMIRIAINFDDFLYSKMIAKKLKKLGYKIALNLMQANHKSLISYKKTVSEINKWKLINILVFADSLGNMDPDQVKDILKIFKLEFDKEIGIHTHNNKGFALINSLVSATNGIDWIDSTICGMGRGAGNVTTENLLIELNQRNLHKGNVKQLQNTVDDFTKLQFKFKWGSNIYYHYAANNNIHPTFVQTLLSDNRYEKNQIFNSLEFLAKIKSTSFSDENLRKAIYGKKFISKGVWKATNWLKDRDVLIIGPGLSIKKFRKEIINYIKKNDIIVIFLNIPKYITEKYANATIVCHETRVMLDSHLYKKLKKPIIMPKNNFDKLIKNDLKKSVIFDYALNIDENKYDIKPNYCIISKPIVASYAFAFVTQANANRILIAGFDGYDEDDYRSEEMTNIFREYREYKRSKKILSLTPTKYKIEEIYL